MVRTPRHVDRIMADIAQNPGLVLFTIVNADIRVALEQRCAALGLPYVGAIDPVLHALSEVLGKPLKARPGPTRIQAIGSDP